MKPKGNKDDLRRHNVTNDIELSEIQIASRVIPTLRKDIESAATTLKQAHNRGSRAQKQRIHRNSVQRSPVNSSERPPDMPA